METHTAQLRHQIAHTRAAMDATLTQLEQRASHIVAATGQLSAVVPVPAVREAVAKGTRRLRQVPWLTVGAGMLLEVLMTEPPNHRRLCRSSHARRTSPRPRHPRGWPTRRRRGGARRPRHPKADRPPGRLGG
jgi:hypothetical protein